MQKPARSKGANTQEMNLAKTCGSMHRVQAPLLRAGFCINSREFLLERGFDNPVRT